VQIIVNELAIENAVERARQRFQRADQRLSRALDRRAPGAPWMALGVIASSVGSLALMGLFPMAADALRVIAIPSLVLGGAFLGYGLPRWWRARNETRRRTREWQHALEMLSLREQQLEEDPELTVEVLDRTGRTPQRLTSRWSTCTSAAAKYVQ